MPLFFTGIGSTLYRRLFPSLLGIGLLVPCSLMSAAESVILPIKVRFWADEIELTGALPDRKTADQLLIAIHRTQPEAVVRDRLLIDPHRTVIALPDSRELAGLLLELALSTKDGSLLVTNREVVVSGLSDSLVTHAAFEARLAPLASRHPERQWRNRICLVPEEDLDPSLIPRRPRPALNPRPLEVAPVELADSSYGPQPRIVATPLVGFADPVASDEVATPSGSVETVSLEVPVESPTDLDSLELVDQIRFAANSYLVAFDQYRIIDAATERIRSIPEAAGQVVLRAYPDTSGKHDYNDWLCQSRARSVVRALVEAGFPEENLRIEILDGSRDRERLGTVRIFSPRRPSAEPESDPGFPSTPVPLNGVGDEVGPVKTASSASPLEVLPGR